MKNNISEPNIKTNNNTHSSNLKQTTHQSDKNILKKGNEQIDLSTNNDANKNSIPQTTLSKNENIKQQFTHQTKTTNLADQNTIDTNIDLKLNPKENISIAIHETNHKKILDDTNPQSTEQMTKTMQIDTLTNHNTYTPNLKQITYQIDKNIQKKGNKQIDSSKNDDATINPIPQTTMSKKDNIKQQFSYQTKISTSANKITTETNLDLEPNTKELESEHYNQQ